MWDCERGRGRVEEPAGVMSWGYGDEGKERVNGGKRDTGAKSRDQESTEGFCRTWAGGSMLARLLT